MGMVEYPECFIDTAYDWYLGQIGKLYGVKRKHCEPDVVYRKRIKERALVGIQEIKDEL